MRAQTKCSRCKGFGHTIRRCQEIVAPAANIPAIQTGPALGGPETHVHVTRKRQQEDDSGDESGSAMRCLIWII